MSSPYPKATLDIFGFPVGAHSVAGRDVLCPRLPKITLFGAKKAVFGTKLHFFEISSKFFDIIMTLHQKDNLFVLAVLQGGLLDGCQGPFMAQN